MFKAIKEFLFGKAPEQKAPEVAPVTEVPYKVETPVVVAVDPAVNPVVSTTNETVVIAEKPAKKQGAPKKQGGAKKQGGSKPRKPKAPKAPKA